MEANLHWTGGMQFVCEADSGHAVVIDGPPDIGGRNSGVRPMEMILMGLGGCASVDVVHILNRARQNVENVDVKVSADRAETDPKVFTKINLHFAVKGEGLSEKQVARAVSLSAEKYCSASIMLRPSVDITHSHEIVE
jgi:putative redox protein